MPLRKYPKIFKFSDIFRNSRPYSCLFSRFFLSMCNNKPSTSTAQPAKKSKLDVDLQLLDVLSKVFNLDSDPILLNYARQKQLGRHAKGFWILEGVVNCMNGIFNSDSDEGKNIDYFYEYLETALNTGHFSQVPDLYRLIYSVLAMVRAYSSFRDGNDEEAMWRCDEGLLKGYELDENALSEFGEILADNLPDLPNISFPDLKPISPPKSLQNSVQIPVEEMPSLETFQTKYFGSQRPCIIRGLVSRWPCYDKWTFDYLYQKLGRRTVPVEIGSKYTDADWRQELMTFGRYLSEFVANGSSPEPGYMAQHRLLDQVPSLTKDIVVPDYVYLADQDDEVTYNCFIGPSNTVSPLHTDPRNNFFCQVRGRKFVRLISPEFKDKIYLFDDFLRANSSQVDVENPDLSKFPQFDDVLLEDFVMEPGDILFIPQGYFHHIRALQPSISLAIWFGPPKSCNEKAE